VLLAAAARFDLRLAVLHLDHRLRGAESRGDAQFVRELAERCHLPFVLRKTDVGALGGNLEQAARSARLEFYREMIASGAVDRVALGHTRSDQAETVLYRFLRGSGTAGLAGIRPVTSDGIIRPLIAVERSEIERYLAERSIVWREDSTNRSPRFARNRIRHHLLPQLAHDWNPAITPGLARVAEWAEAEEAWWEQEIDRLSDGRLIQRDGTILVRAESLTGLPTAVARRMVRRAVERVKNDLRGIDFGHIAAVLDLAQRPQGTGRFHAPGIEVRRSFDWLRFSKPGRPESGKYRINAPVPGLVHPPGAGFALSLQLVEKRETSEFPDSVYNREIGCLDFQSLSGSLECRNWQPGDRYQPLGSACEKKLKTLFQESHVPSWDRLRWPILIDGASVVWARWFGVAARCAVKADSSMVLIVQETPEHSVNSESGL
jgi:tRNA(Ile)-lysidine synthase